MLWEENYHAVRTAIMIQIMNLAGLSKYYTVLIFYQSLCFKKVESVNYRSFVLLQYSILCRFCAGSAVLPVLLI